ncbi:MAG TPA: alpha/beta fold hydrolase [Aggregatilineales bacterium]|nr:alpha/beta fold hydrolase [Aggregatilineales bacterium]
MSVDCVHFPSGEAELVGVFYRAIVAGPCPTAILLHGVPGGEKNLDIAYRLRELGWQTLIPSFRGTWGSGGDYDLTTQPDDAIAAVDYVTQRESLARIALIGYSLGNRAALVAAARDPRVGAVVSLAGFADFDDVMLGEAFFADTLPFLRGATVSDLKSQWARLGGEWNPLALAPRLRQPMLIVHGTEDETVPFYMAEALHAATQKRASLVSIDGADHTFTRDRTPLVAAVTTWLDQGSAEP